MLGGTGGPLAVGVGKDAGDKTAGGAVGVGGVRPSLVGRAYGKMTEAAAVNRAADIKVSGRAMVVSYTGLEESLILVFSAATDHGAQIL
jgi:hypothetical protein